LRAIVNILQNGGDIARNLIELRRLATAVRHRRRCCFSDGSGTHRHLA